MTDTFGGAERRRVLGIVFGLAVLVAPPVPAEVVRITVSSRAPILDARSFGAVGPYEDIKGVAFARSTHSIGGTRRSRTSNLPGAATRLLKQLWVDFGDQWIVREMTWNDDVTSRCEYRQHSSEV